MDNRVKHVVDKEEEKKKVNNELRERYRRVLKRTMMSFDSPGKERVVYENERMIDHVQDELDNRVKYMDTVGIRLESRLSHTRVKLEKHETDKLQQRVELLNQKIRVLEATVRHIK